MKTLLATALLATASLHAGLIHSYTFDVNANDQTGTDNAGLNGGATVANGFLTLDGTGSADFATHLIPTTGSYSVVLDFRLNGAQNGIAELISQGTSGGPGFYIGSNGGPLFRITDSWPYSPVVFPSDDIWHRIGLVVDADAGDSKVYLDGALAGTLGFAIATTSGGSDTRFGRQFGGNGENFKGDLDNVRIYDSAITLDQVSGTDTPEPSAVTLFLAGGVAVVTLRSRRG